ncbi:hypothetical protein [Dysgonomonas sp. 520]|uniref:hypothetical protein n=1 Tax=Dysgonomonas sp. 520 TaxID=2302931 RepID=UPI0013D12908|nr:hypothetical protein [Dysgonomonas sp. 520]NDW08068.1 hypothetical protein [Dysgonomonas sp. 520]
MNVLFLIKKVRWIMLLSASLFVTKINAQTGVSVNLEADVVSSYVWRGFKQAGASIQPSLGVEYKGVSLSAWASTDIAGDDKKEVDFTLGYAVSGFNASLTDYWWDGEYANRYFSYPAEGNAGHLLEASISYTLSEAFPLTVSWNTFLLGRGNKKANGDNSFSTYIEASYPFVVKDMEFSISAGFIPWESAVYGADMDGFKFTNIQLGATRDIKINERFSLPVFANIIANPAVEDIHFVFGFRIK